MSAVCGKRRDTYSESLKAAQKHRKRMKEEPIAADPALIRCGAMEISLSRSELF